MKIRLYPEITDALPSYRWKERFFILTNDYFHCFKKGSVTRVTEMGEFMFKVKVAGGW